MRTPLSKLEYDLKELKREELDNYWEKIKSALTTLGLTTSFVGLILLATFWTFDDLEFSIFKSTPEKPVIYVEPAKLDEETFAIIEEDEPILLANNSQDVIINRKQDVDAKMRYKINEKVEDYREEVKRQEEEAKKAELAKQQTQVVSVSSNPFSKVGYQIPTTSSSLSTEEFNILCRITEAEAGVEPYEGKVWVAHSIMNRVASSKFPNSVEEVVFSKNSKGGYQYQPISNGRYYTVKVSQDSIKAVQECLNNIANGVDPTNGATFFMYPEYSSENGRKYQESLQYCGKVGHHVFSKNW